MTTGRLRVVVSDATGREVPEGGLARWLARVAPSGVRGLVSVAVVSDARVRALNRRYRRRNAVTDVLSFPYAPELLRLSGPRRTRLSAFARARVAHRSLGGGSPAPREAALKRPRRRPSAPIPNPESLIPLPYLYPCLGDIVIARGVARRQALAAGHDERTELRILALHGLLHLLGYDHHLDDGQMARMERRLRKKGGLREGLIERSRP
jgi:probable rRNA maturation factor